MNDWVKNIYRETNQIWKEIGSPYRGYAIFYSPVKDNPKLMIIGENPAGNDYFDELDVSIPKKHDYQAYNYPLAANMKKIFSYGEIEAELFDSVKLNLNFFASKTLDDLVYQNYFKRIDQFSKCKVIEIIRKLNPKIILAEGVGTFNKLIEIGKGEEIIEPVIERNNRIFRKGLVFKSIRLIGIPHPTGARGISDETRERIGKLIAYELRIK